MPHRWGLGAFVVAELVYLVTSVALALVVGDAPAVATVALIVAVPTVLAALVAVLITRVRGNGPRVDLKLRWSGPALAVGLLFGAGGLVLTIPAAMLWVQIVGEDANSAAGVVFSGLRGGWPSAVLVFAVIVLVAPLCEEIMYRGLLWGAVERRWGRWVALVVTTVVFALAHLEWTRAPLLVVVAVPIALARLYTDNLTASVVAHQVTNLLPGLVLMFTVAGAVPA